MLLLHTADSGWARSPHQKAEDFAEHLAQVFQPRSFETTSEKETEISKILDAPHRLTLPVKPFIHHGIETVIRKGIHPKKAPGFDFITGTILKEVSDKCLTLIKYIFKAILRVEYFRSQWKVAQITMIPKPGKTPMDVASYRPISLLHVLSKAFEKLLLKRV
jgi:hypothetical protein